MKSSSDKTQIIKTQKMTCRWNKINTEGNGKSSFADASVATVSHGAELTQGSEGESE